MLLQVGSFVAQASWVTALSWASHGDTLLLATGCAEGSVRLHAASTAALGALPDAMADPSAGPADRAMRLVRVIAAPDLRQVTCLELRTETSTSTGSSCSTSSLPWSNATQDFCALCTRKRWLQTAYNNLTFTASIKTAVLSSGNTCAAGEACLHLAIGKSAGSVSAWTSPRFSSLSALEGKAGCGDLCSVQQGSSTVVGVAWALQPTQARDTAAVLTASAQDGSLSSWRWDGQQVLKPILLVCPCNELAYLTLLNLQGGLGWSG